MTPDDLQVMTTDYRPPKNCYAEEIKAVSVSSEDGKISITVIVDNQLPISLRIRRHVLASLIANGATALAK